MRISIVAFITAVTFMIGGTVGHYSGKKSVPPIDPGVCDAPYLANINIAKTADDCIETLGFYSELAQECVAEATKAAADLTRCGNSLGVCVETLVECVEELE